MLFFYEVICSTCKQPFQIKEGTTAYKAYKVNRKGTFQCDCCKRKVEDDSRKYLFNRD